MVVHIHHRHCSGEEPDNCSNQLPEDHTVLHRGDSDSLRMEEVHIQAVEGLLEALRRESAYAQRALVSMDDSQEMCAAVGGDDDVPGMRSWDGDPATWYFTMLREFKTWQS